MLLYVTVIVKPLIPIISDLWYHEFNEVEHISLVHAKYGSHHLQKEVADTDSDNNQKGQTNLKSEDQVPFHISGSVYCSSHDKAVADKQFLEFILVDISKVPISKQGPPPKFS